MRSDSDFGTMPRNEGERNSIRQYLGIPVPTEFYNILLSCPISIIMSMSLAVPTTLREYIGIEYKYELKLYYCHILSYAFGFICLRTPTNSWQYETTERKVPHELNFEEFTTSKCSSLHTPSTSSTSISIRDERMKNVSHFRILSDAGWQLYCSCSPKLGLAEEQRMRMRMGLWDGTSAD